MPMSIYHLPYLIKEVKIMDFDNRNTDNPYEVIEPQKERKKGFSFKQVIIIAIIVSLVGGTAIGAGYNIAGLLIAENISGEDIIKDSSFEKSNNDNETADNTTQVTHNTKQLSIEEIVKKVGPSVVSITTRVETRDFFSNRSIQEGMGSGVIFEIGEEGIMILTNQHVVNNSQQLTVLFDEGVKADAKIVGTDADADLAVIQIAKADIPNGIEESIKAVEFGNSDSLSVGERAIAIGNPLGYNDTVTVGVISALDRELQLADKNLRLVQTDAAINPGNSGGALVNGQGQLIGINTIKIVDAQVEGIGFAIPINYAKPIIQELLDQGYVSRPFLGIVAGDIDEEASEIYKLPIGVYIHDVMEGSAAHKAGIERGDVIIEIDGEKILSMDQLTNLIADKKVGDELKITIIKNGKESRELTTTLQEKQNN
jgi:serine protease Do